MELKQHDITALNNLVNYLSESYEISTIDDLSSYNIKELLNVISTAKKDDGTDYSESWKSRIEYSLKAYFTYIGRPTTLISKVANKRKTNIINEESKQTQSQKEIDNYITYDELKALSRKYSEYNTVNSMKSYLLLASLTLQPPLRPSVYATLRVIHNKTELNDIDNFIVIGQRSGYFYINKDKVSKFTTNKVIKLYPEYFDVVKQSLEYFPRDYLFQYDTDNVHTRTMYLLRKLQSITKHLYTFSMARQAYINHFHELNPKATLEEQNILAKEMRHTTLTSITYYKKKNPVSGNLGDIDTEPIEKRTIEKKQKIIADPSTLSPAQFNRGRRDAIRSANKRRSMGKNSEIKEYTLEKYNIKFNEKTDRYE